MRVFVAQLNPKIGDLDGNTKKILATIEKAKVSRADIVLFPELTICGYPPEDLVFHSSFIDSVEQHLEQIIKASNEICVIVGLPRRNLSKGEKPLLNSAAVINNGQLLGFQDKWLLPNYDVFDERRYFEPGRSTRVWEIKGKKIGIVICEDIWQHAGYVEFTRYERDPIVELVKHKPDILLNLSASPYQFQKPDVRVKVCTKAAKTLNVPVILCCQVGANDQLIFDGYSVYVGKDGSLKQLAKGFVEDDMCVDLGMASCPVPFNYSPMQDLFSALVLGVRDYFYKSGFQKAILGVSGGIDSAVVACIGAAALGPENVLGVFMPSRYTSDVSANDAALLCQNLGMEMHTIEIEGPFKSYLDLLTPHFEGRMPDVTEENLQARARGMILMALSNKLGKVVLSTGNKSENALGYATLYGDMCGGLGVIADVVKTKVYALARWLNRQKEVIPWSTIDRPPSAELKPDQIDLDTLPDYGVVDSVLQGYVENYMTIDEIAEKYNISLEIVINLVRKIHKAEYKRRQGPPMLRVSKKSFGVGRRYPIVQGWM